MRIGGSLFLIAVGAVLRFAITRHYAHGVNIWAVGDILMIVGLVGLVLTAIFLTMRRRTEIIHDNLVPPMARTTYVGPPNDPGVY